MIDANYIYNVCSRDCADEDWVYWPYTLLKSATKIFYDKIEVGYDFVSIVQIEDQKIIAYHSKEAFDTFKNTIETELKG